MPSVMRDTSKLFLNFIVSDEGVAGLALDSWAELEPLVERYLDKYAQDLQSVHAEPLAQFERLAIKAFVTWMTAPGHAESKAMGRG